MNLIITLPQKDFYTNNYKTTTVYNVVKEEGSNWYSGYFKGDPYPVCFKSNRIVREV